MRSEVIYFSTVSSSRFVESIVQNLFVLFLYCYRLACGDSDDFKFLGSCTCIFTFIGEKTDE